MIIRSGNLASSAISAGGDLARFIRLDPGGLSGHILDTSLGIGGSIGRLIIGGYVAGVHSEHPSPGVYAAAIERLSVRGWRLEGKPEDLRAGILGTAVIDPLPDSASGLTELDVRQILEQMIARAVQLGVNATLAVTDREGNILATVRMTDGSLTADPGTSTITAGGIGGLEGMIVASSITAVTKAGTAAFLSTTGNAFTTRTAGQIIQPNFPPGVRFQDSGALFGVQFSSLPTSDINRLPLGLSADPGGVAISDCTGGFLSRPFLPDGIPGTMRGPFSAQSPDRFSVFNTGLQVELLTTNLVAFLADIDAFGDEGMALEAFEDGVIGGGGVVDVSLSATNGIQIFPGSVPLYKTACSSAPSASRATASSRMTSWSSPRRRGIRNSAPMYAAPMKWSFKGAAGVFACPT